MMQWIGAAARAAMTAAVVMMVLGVAAPAKAQSGSIQIEIYKAGFIVGVSGGSGTLHHGGRAYPLTIGGVSLGATIGASRAELLGEVYNLRRPSDIEGTYTAVQAGVAVAGGEKVAELQNSKGVLLKIRGRQIGLEFSLDLSGMQIALKR